MDGDAWWWYGGCGSGGVNNWDLNAVVRFGCGGGRTPPPLPPPPEPEPEQLPVFPPDVWGRGDELLWDAAALMAPLPEPLRSGGGGCGGVYGVDENRTRVGALLPPQQQQQQHQEVLQLPAEAAVEVKPLQLQAAADAPPADNPHPAATSQQETSAGAGAGAGGSRSRRNKKKQAKKTVVRVPADGPPADVWAWRKYGQKPIKGSPYPRGYYRCSSDKNCAARKQVERCRIDPAYLILTYTGKHSNHEVPLHRNSLAGTTRHKQAEPSTPSSSNPGAGTSKQAPAAPTTDQAATSQSTSGGVSMSPSTPLHVELMHGEDQDFDVGGCGDGLQVEDMDVDDVDGDELRLLNADGFLPVQWGTTMTDAVVAASSEWR